MSVQPGDVIGETDCPCCGNRLPVKLNKNKTAYVMCMNIIIPEERERCGYKSSFGRKKSRDLIKQFEAEREKENVKSELAEDAEAGQPGTIEQPGIEPPPAGKPKRGPIESWFG